jgi:hypothetical protein
VLIFQQLFGRARWGSVTNDKASQRRDEEGEGAEEGKKKMKTAHEILLEVVRLKESPEACEPKQILEVLADLARAVSELEHRAQGGAANLPKSQSESTTQEQAQ